MPIHRSTPTPDRLGHLVEQMADWPTDGLPVQLHPGDLGWRWRFGADALARALRVWTSADVTLAVGLVDDSVVRMALAPSADEDEALAATLVRDLEEPPPGTGDGPPVVEARFGTAFRARLRRGAWIDGEPWAPLTRDLRDPVESADLRVEVAGPDRVADRVAVQRAAFPRSTFTAQRWHEMSRSPAYRQARCLVGYDGQDVAVAAATVWSAGPGRPGLLEPVGVHRDHRGHGYGTAISLAAAATLRALGASSAQVVTAASNQVAVATYASAGFRRMPDVPDFLHRRRASDSRR